jgi:hypothetical protein
MEYKRLPKIYSNSSCNHLRLKREWHKHAESWQSNWGIMDLKTILQNKDAIKNIIKLKFKNKCGVIKS